MTDLHITLAGDGALSAQLYRQIRQAILDARLGPGDALPSSRVLARQLEVARNTVVTAYECLQAEGFLTTRVGAGTFVSREVQPRLRTRRTNSSVRPRALWEAVPQGPDMSAVQPEYDFRPGIPDAGRFPFPAWRARLSRLFDRATVGSGVYSGAAGHSGLRTAIAHHIAVSRGVEGAPEDIFITNGSQQAIDLIARVLLEPGDTVAVEDPGYPVGISAFQAHGCRVAGVAVDRDGLVVDSIPPEARAVYVTPSHQYPLGMAMSIARRQALLSWSERVDGVVIEDDYDSEFRFGGRPLETLKNLDSSGRVLYVSTFSKTMLPALRLGFAVIPASLHDAFRKARRAADWHSAIPLQAALFRFMEDGLLARHVRRMRRVYQERHRRILQRVRHEFAGRMEPIPCHGGLHFTVYLKAAKPTDDQIIAARAQLEGVAIVPLSRHFLAAPPRPGFVLGYGTIETRDVDEGLRRLKGCL